MANAIKHHKDMLSFPNWKSLLFIDINTPSIESFGESYRAIFHALSPIQKHEANCMLFLQLQAWRLLGPLSLVNKR